MKQNFYRLSIGVIIMTGILFFSSCQNQKEREIEIYFGNWAETIMMTKMTKLALNDVGINVNITRISPGAIYTSLSKGDGDIFLESWLPQTHGEYWERYGDKLDTVGISFNNASTGLVVPAYVTINSISELNENKEKFNSEIIGIGSGSGVYKDTETAIETYNLDFKQITSSGPAMVATIEKAVADNDWVVVTGWKPHYKWAKFDLKYLDDPKNVYPSEKSYIVTRKGFTEENPGFKEFLSNFYFTEDQLSDMMLLYQQMDDNDAAAQQWYEDHKELFRSWMPEEWLN